MLLYSVDFPVAQTHRNFFFSCAVFNGKQTTLNTKKKKVKSLPPFHFHLKDKTIRPPEVSATLRGWKEHVPHGPEYNNVQIFNSSLTIAIRPTRLNQIPTTETPLGGGVRKKAETDRVSGCFYKIFSVSSCQEFERRTVCR